MNKGLLIVGLILLGIASYLGYNKYTFLQNAITTKVTVISYRTTTDTETKKNGNKRSTKKTTYYYPTFEFKDNQNRLTQVESNVGQGNSKPYSVGSQVEIVYSKENPQDAKINSFFNHWLFTTIIGGLAIILLFLAFAFPRKK